MIGVVNVVFVQPRFLQEEELGLTRLLYGCAYLIGLLIPLGGPNIVVKYFPYFRNKQNGNNGFISFILLLFLAGFIISLIFLLALKPAIIVHYTDDSALFADYFLSLIPFSLITSGILIATAYCHSLFKSTIPSFLNDICVRLGVLLITVFYFNRWINFEQYVYSFVGVYALQLLALIAFLLFMDKISFVRDRELFSKYPAPKMIRFGLLMCAASFASMSIRTVDLVFLGSYSLKMVGIYTTAVFIASFIEVPLGAIERISHTKISDNFSKGNLTENEKIYKESVKYLLLLGGLLFIGINACTKYIYQIGKLPESYVEYIDVVYIISFGALVNISTGINSSFLLYSKHYILGTLILFLMMIVNLILNFTLIPVYGIYGAAFSSVLSIALFNLIKFVFIYNKFKFQPYTLKSLWLLCIILICTGIAHVLPEFNENPFLNLFYKGGTVSLLYLLIVYYFNLAPGVFDSMKSRMRALFN